MAKRYKKRAKKVKPLLLIIIVIAFLLCLAIYLVCNKDTYIVYDENQTDRITEKTETNDQIKKGDKIEPEKEGEGEGDKSIGLSSSLMAPEELNKDVVSNLNEQLGEAELVKLQYQLVDLDNGTIYLYYKVNSKKLMEVKIDVNEKSIVSFEEYKDEELLNKNRIQDNLHEDIAKDFEEGKDLLSEGKVLNIIITDTEVILNTSYV